MKLELLKLRDVAEQLQISISTLRRYLRAGEGPRYHRLPGGRIVFKANDVQAWLNQLPGAESCGVAQCQCEER